MKPVIAIALLLLMPALARAANVSYAFTAELDGSGFNNPVSPAGLIAEDLEAGNIATLTGVFTYDNTTPNGPPSPFGFSYDTGMFTLDQVPDTPTFVYFLAIANNVGTPQIDSIRKPQQYDDETIALHLVDNTPDPADALSVGTLPASIGIDLFPLADIIFSTFEGEGEDSVFIELARYNITSWQATTIPEPASAAMLGLGAIALLRRRNRQPNHLNIRVLRK